MWLFTKFGFVSVVQDADRRDVMWLRFRCRVDAERFANFAVTVCEVPRPQVLATPDSDYRFRFELPRIAWLDVAEWLACEIDYPNFKQSTLKDASVARWGAYHQVWLVMAKFQDDEDVVEPGPVGTDPGDRGTMDGKDGNEQRAISAEGGGLHGQV